MKNTIYLQLRRPLLCHFIDSSALHLTMAAIGSNAAQAVAHMQLAMSLDRCSTSFFMMQILGAHAIRDVLLSFIFCNRYF